MIPAIVTSLILSRKRITLEVVPPRLKQIWTDWQLRVLVLFSLLLQLLLILLGNRRRCNPKLWIRVMVWCAYLLADTVATMALGGISTEGGVVNDLTTFWAPFLLLHLGGPDTITAYSLEDATLWLRRLFDMLTQTTAVVYIFLTAWSSSRLSILTILMFIAGLIKYGERTWNLWKANNDELSGGGYQDATDEFVLNEAETQGDHSLHNQVVEVREGLDAIGPQQQQYAENYIIEAHSLLEKFKGLFADLLLSSQVAEKSRSLFLKMPVDRAFNVIETELGFMYDLVYTKAKVIYTPLGLASRFLTLALTCFVLVIFSFEHGKKKYNNVDESITFLLLVVAVFLEIYAAMVLLFSDETKFWLIKRKVVWPCLYAPRCTAIPKPINLFKLLFEVPRWSNLMGQCSLLSLCVKEEPGFKLLRAYRYLIHSEVNPGLRRLILERVQQNLGQSMNPRDLEYRIRVEVGMSLGERLQSIVAKYNEDSTEFNTIYVKNDLDKNILTWHIATELCYYRDGDGTENRQVSLSLSRYLMYLLVFYPSMLPIGIISIDIGDLLDDTRKLLKDKLSHSYVQMNTEDALRRLWYKIDEKYGFRPIKVKGFKEKNAIVQGCSLSRRLDDMSEDKNTKWDLIRDVWLEILAYAAQQSRGSDHLQQLRRGGELLTHVWLLYAHFGMTGQFQTNLN